MDAEERLRPWRVRAEQTLVARPPFIELSVQTVELPNGRLIDDFYQIAMPDYVCVFAETGDGQVLLLRSYRHGARKVCLNFPGGRINAGETPAAAAARELLEETGHEAIRWTSLGRFVTQANQRCQTAYFFRAAGCRFRQAPASGDLEDQELVLMSVDGAFAAAREGGFAVLEHVAILALATHPCLGKPAPGAGIDQG
jgi:ADP-ribose pyrophosphatase